MKLKTFFQHAVEIGISADPRGKALVAKMLRKERERQKKLEGKEKELADPERTWNPYADSRIIAGTGE
ncbi:NGG1p interacting factor NIF3, partial [Candidatus Peregrinibacteria bacterium]|nr:NGG1p interacting factor NIF3 [Candidatus Peregrinibacteria bacterium]